MNVLPDRNLRRVADIENIAAPAPEFTPSRIEDALGFFKPLALADVLARVDTLHASCQGGGHLCGLPARLIKFDLLTYVTACRAYRVAQRETA